MSTITTDTETTYVSGIQPVKSSDPGDTRVPAFVKADQVRYTFLMIAFLECKIDEIPDPDEYGVSDEQAAAFSAEWYIADCTDHRQFRQWLRSPLSMPEV